MKRVIQIRVILGHKECVDDEVRYPHKDLLSKIWLSTIRKKPFSYLGYDITDWKYNFKHNMIEMISPCNDSYTHEYYSDDHGIYIQTLMWSDDAFKLGRNNYGS